ncbi:MAG TPA: helix-turn-helix domain-containing protein [Actinomycetota bacterium]|nr:helix-turn-helix domain-containing protein [Actinomycetota bacterium]
MAGSVKPRPYRSPIREDQAKATRRRVLEAALHLFTDAGYHATTIETVSAESGVAVPTIYKSFRNKGALLREAVQLALTGDEQREPLMQRPWWQEQLESPDPGEQLRLIARNARAIWGRAASIVDMLRTAATLDPETGDEWRAVNDDRLERSRLTARSLARKGGLRKDLSTSAVADVLVNMTSVELYLLFVRDRGWSESRYEAWLADALQSLLLQPE